MTPSTAFGIGAALSAGTLTGAEIGLPGSGALVLTAIITAVLTVALTIAAQRFHLDAMLPPR